MPGKPMFSPAQDAEIRDQYLDGATAVAIAAGLGCSITPVLAALRRQGVARKTPAERAEDRRRWTREQEDEYLQWYRDGATVQQLAVRLKVRTDAVTDLLNRHNEPRHPGGRYHPIFASEEQRRALKEDYLAGAGLVELAEKYGCTAPSIRNTLKRMGVERRTRGRQTVWTEETLRELLSLHDQGVSQRLIAERLGFAESSVKLRLRQMGLTKPRPCRRRDAHPFWKGGRAVDPNGYVSVLPSEEDLQFCIPNGSGRVLEHRLVMGRMLGRPLRRTESVHHINGDRSDNRPENLQLRQGQHGAGVVMVCQSCGSHDVQTVSLAD